MSESLFLGIVGTTYPILKDVIVYVVKRRGALSNKPKFREQMKKMITFTEDDLSKLKDEVGELRRVCAELNIPTGERGSVPWQIPHDVNSYLTWRYRRTSRKIENIGRDFRASMEGIVDVISCCAGVMEGIAETAPAGAPAPAPYEEPDWARDLGRHYQDLVEKLVEPSKYSVDELSNAMEQFLDQSRLAMQKLAKFT
jgi:polyhydroxyalkanoate synthesis regulator phasin